MRECGVYQDIWVCAGCSSITRLHHAQCGGAASVVRGAGGGLDRSALSPPSGRLRHCSQYCITFVIKKQKASPVLVPQFPVIVYLDSWEYRWYRNSMSLSVIAAAAESDDDAVVIRSIWPFVRDFSACSHEASHLDSWDSSTVTIAFFCMWLMVFWWFVMAVLVG